MEMMPRPVRRIEGNGGKEERKKGDGRREKGRKEKGERRKEAANELHSFFRD
jgi:hypothetical protein